MKVRAKVKAQVEVELIVTLDVDEVGNEEIEDIEEVGEISDISEFTVQSRLD